MSYDAASFKAGFAVGRMMWRPPTQPARKTLKNWIIAYPGLVLGEWIPGGTCTIVDWTPDVRVYAAAWKSPGYMWTPMFASTHPVTLNVSGGNGVTYQGEYNGYYIYAVNGRSQQYSAVVYTYPWDSGTAAEFFGDVTEDLP